MKRRIRDLFIMVLTILLVFGLTQYWAYMASSARDAIPTTPQPTIDPLPSSGTVYRNCTEARAAGPTPLTTTDPGYAPHLDRDHDGLACE